MRSTRRSALAIAGGVMALALVAHGQERPRYSVTRSGDVVRLEDARAGLAASLVATMGNVYELQVKGQDVLRKTFSTVDEFIARPGLNGIPLLAPFANRLDEPAFYANGRKYLFDLELGNVRAPIPIHGVVSGAKEWRLVEAAADERGAWTTSILDFYKVPAYVQQFPFAHTITMTHRVQDGVLEVTTRLDNLSAEPMPVSIGFHPYFQLTDSRRDDWTLSVGARTHWPLSSVKIPTGETQPIGARLSTPGATALKSVDLDDVFSDLVRDADGRAVVTLKGTRQQLDVLIGPAFKALVLYSPNAATSTAAAALQAPGQGFMAIEPMAAITDAMNLAHRGLYGELQSIAPGGSWTGTFWIRPSGF